GIFRGTLDVRASDINEEMKIAAAKAIASIVTENELSPDYIIPRAFDKRVGKAVAEAVSKAAIATGVNRI
ncbi:MAG: NAD-dependent malic enzyme, partial [Clostridia bacterium]